MLGMVSVEDLTGDMQIRKPIARMLFQKAKEETGKGE